MENLIEKINQILKENKITENDVEIKDETDVIRFVERLVHGNLTISSQNYKLQKTVNILATKIQENDAKIAEEIRILRTDTRFMAEGETPYQIKVANGVHSNGNAIHSLHDKVLKVYRGLRNQFGKTAFWYDENKI
jgi:hypothetical protein